jgi:hypothetical protein
MTTAVGSVVLHLTDRSWVNVIHGAVFGGAFLLTIVVAIIVVVLARPGDLTDRGVAESGRWLAWSILAMVVAGWVAVLTGTFVVDVWFHAAGPSSAATLLRDSATYRIWGADLIRVKEVVSWGAAVLATAAAYVAYRRRFRLAGARRPRALVIALLAAALTAAGIGGALGVLLTKLAPLM